MRTPKIHFMVPAFGYPVRHAAVNTLCRTPGSMGTGSKEMVTCRICQHFIKEYGEKHMVPRRSESIAPFSARSAQVFGRAFRPDRNMRHDFHLKRGKSTLGASLALDYSKAGDFDPAAVRREWTLDRYRQFGSW